MIEFNTLQNGYTTGRVVKFTQSEVDSALRAAHEVGYHALDEQQQEILDWFDGH